MNILCGILGHKFMGWTRCSNYYHSPGCTERRRFDACLRCGADRV